MILHDSHEPEELDEEFQGGEADHEQSSESQAQAAALRIARRMGG